jgi:hypothetical protein
MDRLAEMVEAQRQFQDKLGHDFTAMNDRDRIAYVKEMYIAAVQELGEALSEVSWKSWAAGDAQFGAAAFVCELSDTWQFITNMWFAALPDMTPEFIAGAMHTTLMSKLRIDYTRIDKGYDGVSTKCRRCKRALDDTNVHCTADKCDVGPYLS